MLNQTQVKKLSFATLTEIKACTNGGAIGDRLLSYCAEVKTFYYYLTLGAAFTANDMGVLVTGDGGDTRWIAIAGQYFDLSMADNSQSNFIAAGSIPSFSLQDVYNNGNTITTNGSIDIEFALSSGGFKLTDGNQALGKVWTSDADGKGGWQTPAGVSVISLTYLASTALVLAATVVDGQLYLITDKGDTGLLLMGMPNGKSFSIVGSAGFLNCDFANIGDYSGVVALTGIAKGDNQKVWNATEESGYVDGDIVFQDGNMYQVIDDASFTGDNPSLNTAAYQKLIANTTLTYNTLAGGVFGVGETISNGNTGAQAIIVTDNGSDTMTVRLLDILGWVSADPFDNGTGVSAVVDVVTYGVKTTTLGYIEEWDEVDFDYANAFISRRKDILNNDVTFNSISTFQWGNQYCNNNLVDGSSYVNTMNQKGTFQLNHVTDLSTVTVENTHYGTISACYFGNGANITANKNTGKSCASCKFDIAVAFTLEPTRTENSKTIDVNGSTFETTILIDTVTTLPIPANDKYCGVINLGSNQVAETIDKITGFVLQIPFKIYPASAAELGHAFALTIAGTALASITSGNILMPTADIVLDGNKSEWIELVVAKKSGQTYLIQKDAMNGII